MIKKIMIFIIIGLGLAIWLYKPIANVAVTNETIALELINAERVKRKLPKLTINVKLSNAARFHANNMANKNILSHTLNGDLVSRLSKMNYNWNICAENIAAGQLDIEQAHKGWMNSSGHRANILNKNVTELGVGVATSKNNTPYYCTVFGRPSTN